jgi:hypothetical protein
MPSKGQNGSVTQNQMLKKVALSLADPGQAALEVMGADDDTEPPSKESIRALAGINVPAVVKFTLGSFRDLKFVKMHKHDSPKSLSWALEEVSVKDLTPEALSKYKSFRKIIEELALPKVGGRKPKTPASNVVSIFKSHCQTLGLRFDPNRPSDILDLLAAIHVQDPTNTVA